MTDKAACGGYPGYACPEWPNCMHETPEGDVTVSDREDFERFDAAFSEMIAAIQRGEALNASPELQALAEKAAAHQAAEREKLAAMTAEDRETYIRAWAERLAADVAGIND